MDKVADQSENQTKHSTPTVQADNKKGDENDNIFKFPPDMKDLRQRFQRLLDYAEHEEESYKSLGVAFNKTDCKQEELEHEIHHEYTSQQDMTALENSAALATYGTIRELTSLYTILDELSTIEDIINKRRSVLNHAKMLRERAMADKESKNNLPELKISNDHNETQNTSALLGSVITAGNSASARRNEFKRQRERSKSAIPEEISLYHNEHHDNKESQSLTQVNFNEGKSKVSKWTKVKAAFKWERANVPALGDNIKNSSDVVKSIGLMPVNNEVARYLCVPLMPYAGTSSVDSMLSSSSGYFLNEMYTPGTMSSASSMDGIETQTGRNIIKSDKRLSDEGISSSKCCQFLSSNANEQTPNRINCACSNIFIQSKSSNKSSKKNNTISDIEELPQNDVANITTMSSSRIKGPPSPLNLDHQQELNDLEDFYLIQQLRSPKDVTQQCNRLKKTSFPGNSSVPSSPSRLSDFFAELESEDISSGDFSEPTSPLNLSPQQIYEYRQNEINRRYELLKKKLEIEFEAKKREWEKMKTSNVCRAPAYNLVSSPKIEETQPNQAKLLEENLTPEFKKKLEKWRVKKQGAPENEQLHPHLTSKEVSSNDLKSKIDWNLWKAGQIKFDGPEHKNLPGEFQKKLEQWNKIKKNNMALSGSGSIKRNAKSADGIRKSNDDDRGVEKEKRTITQKNIEKEKLERISKIKAMVADHPIKEVEVKTSAGVMKFEGISRKFTRKLYEWEKARGIGPELSTFALLHPGYCPIDVGRISKESPVETSPTINRSLSLDSLTPNVAQPNISQQASSQSLNDVNDFKERDGLGNKNLLSETDSKKFDEPEAVMVEVEDHIVETASPLVTKDTLIEQQTPIYKYESSSCNDFCDTKHIQSYESHLNLAPLLAVLKRSDELIGEFSNYTLDKVLNGELQFCQNVLTSIRNTFTAHIENLMKPPVLNAISDVQSELSRLSELLLNSPIDEACCQEIIEERSRTYSEELKGLNEALGLLRMNIDGDSKITMELMQPNVNITSTVLHDASICVVNDVTRAVQSSNSSDFVVSQGESLMKSETSENSIGKCRNTSTTSLTTNTGSKKKMRLKRMGSRQNSKTESDSSDNNSTNLQETPRRWKRKNYRIKQRSFDADDFRRHDESAKPVYNRFNDDMVYVLRVKPGHPIEQCEINRNLNGSTVLISPTESCIELMPLSAHPNLDDVEASVNKNSLSNIFVKTIRKIFRTIEEPSSSCGVVVVEQRMDENSDIIDTKETQSLEKDKIRSSYVNSVKEKFSVSKENGTQENHDGIMQTFREGNADGNSNLLRCSQLMQRSWSWNNSRRESLELVKRKCQSIECLDFQRNKGFKMPLATDSFKINKKHCVKTSCLGSKVICVTPKRKEHRFKKNTDKFYKIFSKYNENSLKKCETKVIKANFNTASDNSVKNTLISHINIIEPQSNEIFAPTPKLLTPLSERAQQLQQAKQKFLESPMPRPKSVNKRKNEAWEQNNLSDHNAKCDNEGSNLLKSLSAGTILQTGQKQQSETTYDTIPRSYSSRSEKLSARLGLASIASKFRRSKKEEKQTAANGTNASALSTLCKQSLLADPIAVPHAVAIETKESSYVRKSQSSQAAVGYIETKTLYSAQVEKLNKSKSEQNVKNRQENLYK